MTLILLVLTAISLAVITLGLAISQDSGATSHPTLIREGDETYLRPALWEARTSLLVRLLDKWHSLFG